MFKHTQTIRRQIPTNWLSVFDHFVGLALKVLRKYEINVKFFFQRVRKEWETLR